MGELTLYHLVGGDIWSMWYASTFQTPLDPAKRRDYEEVHSRTNGDAAAVKHYVGQQWIPPGMGYRIGISRSLFRFSGTVPANVTAASIFIYGNADYTPTRYPTLVLVPGDISTYSNAAYGELLGKTTSLGELDTSAGWNQSDWNEIPLNSAGLAYLQASGTNPRFGVRSQDDISAIPPTINEAYDCEIVSYYDGVGGSNAYIVIAYGPTPTVPTNPAVQQELLELLKR